VRELLARIRSYLRHRVLGGESLIAMEYKGEEVIHEEEWSKLPKDERAKWEPADESMPLYRRKPW
jgi:hypothetical protein